MLTQTNIRSMYTAFQQENEKAKVYAGQKSSIYQAIINDFKSRETKSTVSKNRRDRKGLTRPSYVAPLAFGHTATRKVEILWPCEMVAVDSSFITAVGYNSEYRVLKVTMGKYTYAYQDVPEAIYQGFFNAPSVGKYYNKVKGQYAGIALV